MTAYASSDLQQQGGRAKWEIKSVNHRYLELSFKLPERLRSLEFSLREFAKQQLHRGKVECWLQWENSSETKGAIAVNQDLVKELSSACHEINNQFQEQFRFQVTLSPLDILKWPEVCTTKENNLDLISHDLVAAFKVALDQLVTQRSKEGSALAKIIFDRLDDMEKVTHKIKERSPLVLKNQRDKIIGRLNDLKTESNPERIEQEMVYLAQKLDITEELDRLLTHIQTTRSLMKKGGVVGRHMDFLMQELNREANTLSSKSTEIDVIQMGMEIKLLIEQIREQVQNLE